MTAEKKGTESIVGDIQEQELYFSFTPCTLYSMGPLYETIKNSSHIHFTLARQDRTAVNIPDCL